MLSDLQMVSFMSDRSIQKVLFIHPAGRNQLPKVVYIITTNTSRDFCQLQQATPIIMYEDKWKIHYEGCWWK